MYALVDSARSFSAINQQQQREQQSNGDTTTNKRKREICNDSEEGEEEVRKKNEGEGGNAMSNTTGNGGNNGNQSRGKKWNDSRKKNNEDVDIPVRILSRKYLLTKTGYKYIEVGITATLPSRVNIVIGDNYGKEIPLTPTIWKDIVEHKTQVISHLQRGNVEGGGGTPTSVPPNDIRIDGDLTLHFGKINNMPIMNMESSTARMTLSQNTVNNMYQLEFCIDRIVKSLCSITENVNAKLQLFLDIARSVPRSTNVAKTIRDSEHFDRNDIIDCELVALLFSKY